MSTGSARARWRAATAGVLVSAWLGFGYAAGTAVADPDAMPHHLASFAPIRIDSFGVGCFATSFLAQAALGRRRRVALLGAILTHASIGVAYVALIALTHPSTLGLRLTHLSPWPSEAMFGLACLVVMLASGYLLAVPTRGAGQVAVTRCR